MRMHMDALKHGPSCSLNPRKHHSQREKLVFVNCHADLVDRTDLEQLLVDVGAVQIGDSRLRRNKTEDTQVGSSKIRKGKTGGDSDDSDWD